MGTGDSITVDVLILGGGVQGLLLLDRLAGEGRSTALVTSSDLGTGQTLHSHGVLNAGFGLAGPEPVDLLQRVVKPDLQNRGVETYGEWGAVVPAGFPEGEPMTPSPGLDLRGGRFQRLPEVNVDTRALLEALRAGVEDRIIRGSVSAVQRGAGGEVQLVEIERVHGSGTLAVAPAAVVVASGTGTKSMLRRLGADEQQLEPIKHRRVHVLCVRGASAVLPPLNVFSMPDLLFVAAHQRDATVTWYATPMEFGGPHVEDAPDDAVAEVDDELVERGWSVLFELYPPLGALSGLRFSSYAGYRQDIGDTPGVSKCERIAAAPNVICALPSGLLGAWPVAAGGSILVSEVIGQSGRPQPPIPGGGVGVRLGRGPADDDDFEWTATSRGHGSR